MVNRSSFPDATHQGLRQRIVEIEAHLRRLGQILVSSQHGWERAQCWEDDAPRKSRLLEAQMEGKPSAIWKRLRSHPA